MTGIDYFIHTPTVSVGANYDVDGGVDYVIGLFRVWMSKSACR